MGLVRYALLGLGEMPYAFGSRYSPTSGWAPVRSVAFLTIILLASSGCLQSGTTNDEDPVAPLSPDLASGDATVVDDGMDRILEWEASLGPGGFVPLVGPAPGSESVVHAFEVDSTVRTVTLVSSGFELGAFLYDSAGHELCAARREVSCSVPVAVSSLQEWRIEVFSLAADGGTAETTLTLSPHAPVLGTDPTQPAGFDIYEWEGTGDEPTLAASDEEVLATAWDKMVRLDSTGSFQDVTPPADDVVNQVLEPVRSGSLDPFLIGDPETGRVYLTQLGACMRVSWTDTMGSDWTTYPLACGGPEQHHQKLDVGPSEPITGLPGRALHMLTMNLGSWLATDEIVLVHSVSVDDGATWIQRTAWNDAVNDLRPRLSGNIAVSPTGDIHAISYLCQGSFGYDLDGVGVGTSHDSGASWTWTQIAPGGGPCMGLDPGLTAVGDSVHAVWFDHSMGTPRLWHGASHDAGDTWGEPEPIPTPGLKSFFFTDATAWPKEEPTVLAAMFFASPDTTLGPTPAEGWARWFPYIATKDLTSEDSGWDVRRLEDHPVQIGRSCLDGPTCLGTARNLADFVDIQFTPDGRIVAAYADGCLDGCTTLWESRDDHLRVAVERR